MWTLRKVDWTAREIPGLELIEVQRGDIGPRPALWVCSSVIQIEKDQSSIKFPEPELEDSFEK